MIEVKHASEMSAITKGIRKQTIEPNVERYLNEIAVLIKNEASRGQQYTYVPSTLLDSVIKDKKMDYNLKRSIFDDAIEYLQRLDYSIDSTYLPKRTPEDYSRIPPPYTDGFYIKWSFR